MKTLTSTTQNAINYGAVLQSYAFHKYLKNLGIEDELINIKRQSSVYFQKMSLDANFLSSLYNNLFNLMRLKKTFNRVNRFNNFVTENIKVTKEYNNINSIHEDTFNYDVYITGSDQMFNTYGGFSHAGFLRFGNKSTKRISYATSMGTVDVKEEHKSKFIESVKMYNALSLRERRMSEYISNLCGVETETHLDPTFLISKQDWNNLADKSNFKINFKNYILVYLLIYNPLLERSIQRLKKESGLPVVVISPNTRCRVSADCVVYDAGPLEFLRLFKGAEYVLTTSFHGTCFSIIYEKKFYSFIRAKGETRINSLLSDFGLENRIVKSVIDVNEDTIDWSYTRKKNAYERINTKDYIVRALDI